MPNFTVAGILEVINSGGDIPTVASSMRRLLSLNTEESDDVDNVLEIIRYDVAMTARLLRMANAPGQYESETFDIVEAAERLGRINIRNLLLATKFVDDDSSKSETIDDYNRMHWIWERSLFCAFAARVIAERTNQPFYERYYTFGLLLNIGVIFMLHNFPNEYVPIYERWRKDGLDLASLEHDYLSINHSIVGQQIIHNWHLGPEVEYAVRMQESNDDKFKNINLKVLKMANVATSVFFEDNNFTGMAKVVNFAQIEYKIDRDEMLDLLQRISLMADMSMMKSMITIGRTVPYVELLQRINRELGRATLSYEQMVRELEVAMRRAEQLAIRLEEANRKLRDTVDYDPLTKIRNRRFFDEFLKLSFNESKRYSITIGCLMVDIDHFKRVNDTYGHLIGDHVLQGVASTIREKLRDADVVARYGGEEFIILLPRTSPHAVAEVSQKINSMVKELRFMTGEGEIGVTVSVGYVAYSPELLPDISDPVELVKMADANMYEAKHHGRNRVWPPIDKKR